MVIDIYEHLRNVLELRQSMGDSLYQVKKDKEVKEKKESKDNKHH